jgi:hypothetical protein
LRCFVPLVMMLFGCGVGGELDGEQAGSGFCQMELVDVSPVRDSSGVIMLPDYELTRSEFDILSFEWSSSPAFIYVDVVDVELGASVDGRTYEEQGVWYWWPTDYLAPKATFEVQVRTGESCESETVTRFSTSKYGTPVPDECMDGARFGVEVDGAGENLSSYMVHGDLAIELQGEDGVFVVNLADDEQNMCFESSDFTPRPNKADNPMFAAKTSLMTLDYGGHEMYMTDVKLSGMVSHDCGAVRVALSALADVELLGWVVGMSVDQYCAAMDGCVPCNIGSMKCFDLELEGSGRAMDIPLVDVSASDVAATAYCHY